MVSSEESHQVLEDARGAVREFPKGQGAACLKVRMAVQVGNNASLDKSKEGRALAENQP